MALATAPDVEVPKTVTNTIIFSEDAEGILVTVTRTDNSLDTRAKNGTLFLVMPVNKVFDSEAAALEQARYTVGFYARDQSSTDTHVYKGVTITTQTTTENVRSDEVVNVTYMLTGEPVNMATITTFNSGEDVGTFGTLDGVFDHDMVILHAFIDQQISRVDQFVDLVDILVAPEGSMEGAERADGDGFEYENIAFVGWQEAFDMENSPFAPASEISEVESVSGDVIALVKDTGLFGLGANYSSMFLLIKAGYRVSIDVTADDLGGGGFFRDQDVDFQVVLEGGDSFRFDMTGRDAPTILSVMLDGEERAPYTPTLEGTFGVVSEVASVKLLTIHKLVEATAENTPDNDRDLLDDDDDDVTTEEANTFGSLGMLALGAAVLILFVGVLARLGRKSVGGEDDATE